MLAALAFLVQGVHAEPSVGGHCTLYEARLAENTDVYWWLVDFSNHYRVEGKQSIVLAAIESSFDHSKVSEAGAVGVMQVMPVDGTAGEDCLRAGIIDDYAELSSSLEKNVECGVWYFRRSLDYCRSIEGALRRYNGGRCNAYNSETDAFVERFMDFYAECDFDCIPLEPEDEGAVSAEVDALVVEVPQDRFGWNAFVPVSRESGNSPMRLEFPKIRVPGSSLPSSERVGSRSGTVYVSAQGSVYPQHGRRASSAYAPPAYSPLPSRTRESSETPGFAQLTR